MLTPVTRVVPSRSPYLLRPDSFAALRQPPVKLDRGPARPLWKAEVTAIKVGGSKASPTFSIGTLWDYGWLGKPGPPTLDNLIESVDGRYGLRAYAKLNPDGRLWIASPSSPDEIGEARRLLEAVAEAFPEVCEGWTGWWQLA